jgi:hypothetical protein
MFLMLGPRPGEMFALRWNDKQGNSLRIDTAIFDGIDVETKTEGSDAAVWLPVLIEKEIEFWRSTGENARPDSHISILTRNCHQHEQLPFPRAQRGRQEGGDQRRNAPNAEEHLFHLHGPTHDRKGCTGTPAPQLVEDDTGTLHQVRAGERARGVRITRPSVEESARRVRTAHELNPIESNFEAQ